MILVIFRDFSNFWKCEKKKFDEKKYFSQSFTVCKVEEKWVKINFYKFIGCIGEKKRMNIIFG